tara:strand:- start:354 stop:551 length:198 start_codon:yes stop_codon:yes gene_type:complete
MKRKAEKKAAAKAAKAAKKGAKEGAKAAKEGAAPQVALPTQAPGTRNVLLALGAFAAYLLARRDK